MAIHANSLYQCSALALLERLEAGQVKLAYIDSPAGTAEKLHDQPNDRSVGEHLSVMLARVVQQVRRVLSDSGCVYFHCASGLASSAQLILGQVFGTPRPLAEFVWPRQSNARWSVRPTAQHDTIYLYSKGESYTFNQPTRPLSDEALRQKFRDADERGPFMLTDLTAAMNRPELQFEWQGTTPPAGRSWRYSLDKLDELLREGRIQLSQRGRPRLKVYVQETAGVPVGSIWDDISPFLRGAENLRYPGQKPLALLDRVISMGSDPGDLVLDPFCGVGTSLVAAQRLDRRWIGCELSIKAYQQATERLEGEANVIVGEDYDTGCQEDLERDFPVVDAKYAPIATGLDDLATSHSTMFIKGESIELEETRHYEFKEIRSENAPRAIKNTADEYVVAFLNSEGGRIFWGVRDTDRVVTGVSLDSKERDRLRREVTSKLREIQPSVDPTQYRVLLHPVHEQGVQVEDLYVVEVVVPRTHSSMPYSTGGGHVFVRLDGVNRRLSIPEVFEWSKSREEE